MRDSSCARPGRDFSSRGQRDNQELGLSLHPKTGRVLSARTNEGVAAAVHSQAVSAQEVRGLGRGPDLGCGLWALGVGPRLRAVILGWDSRILGWAAGLRLGPVDLNLIPRSWARTQFLGSCLRVLGSSQLS